MSNIINILVILIVFIFFQNLSRLYSSELIFDGHIKYELLKKFDINKNELEFLRLNLSYGHKCRKTFLNTKGFIVGTEDYKKCVLNLGDKN